MLEQCVEAGLAHDSKIHVDSSLIDANASKDSVKRGPPELIAALKQAYQARAAQSAGANVRIPELEGERLRRVKV